MKLDKGRVLASVATLLVMGAVGGSVLLLKKAEATADELAAARRSISEQARVTKRLEAELAGKLARTDAKVYGLAVGVAELNSQRGAPPGAVGSDREIGDPLAPPEMSATAQHAEQATKAIEQAEALVANAAQAGRWTEQDRDRLQELLVQVDGPERRRHQDSVGQLLMEGKLVADEGFVPL